MVRDNIPLLHKTNETGLSLFFAILCVIDIFGVFPIIALTRSIVQCGWLGIPLVLIVFGFQIFTAILLGKSWDLAKVIDPRILTKNRYPLLAVTELTLGRWPSLLVSVLLDLTLFGGGIPNLLVASQNLQLFGLKVSHQEFNLSFCYWLLIVGLLLCPIMWLGSPRDMKFVAIFSTLAVLFTSMLVWWSIIKDERDIPTTPVPTTPSWENFISGYGMLAFQFDVHPTVMTIQVDMKKSKDINKAITLSYITSGALFMVTAGLSVWRYGGSATANLFQLLPQGEAIQAAILISSLQLCLSSAIGHSALFQHIEDQLQIERSFGWRRCAIRSVVVLLSVVLGESVPRFDIVMSLIGGTLTGPLVFILPPLMYSRIRKLYKRHFPSINKQELQTFIPDEKNANRYTFIQSDDNDEMGIQSFEDREYLLTSDADSSKHSIEHRKSYKKENHPIMIEATEGFGWRYRKRNLLNKNINVSRKLCTKENLIDWLGYLIMTVGVIITISSTCINIKNTIKYVKFISPCIVNVSSYFQI